MANMLNEAWSRLNTQTPIFFKKISRTGKGIAATGTAILSSQAIPNVHLSNAVVHIATVMLATGVVASAVSNLAVDDPTQLPKN